MNKKKGKIILVILLLIPIVWVILWKNTRFEFNPLPIYGDTETVPGDTLPYIIPDFSFTNQFGEIVTQKDFEGKIYLANFFFASCEEICPAINNNLRMIYDKYQNHPEVRFISHTVDPDHDSVSVLKEYAERFSVNNNHWHFVTGSKKAIYDLAQYDYRVTATVLDDANFIHSEKIVLIDKDKRIRGYFEGRSTEVIKEVRDAIQILITEYERKK